MRQELLAGSPPLEKISKLRISLRYMIAVVSMMKLTNDAD